MKNRSLKHIKLCIAAIAFAGLSIGGYCAQNIPDIKTFKNKTKVKNSVASFIDSFDGDVSLWRMGTGAKIEKAAGRNGTSALFYQRLKPHSYSLVLRKVKLKPGSVYTASVWIRTLDIKSSTKDKSFGGICIEYSKGGKWHGGTYPQNSIDNSEWHKLSFEFTAKKTADSATISLYMRKGFTGKIWFDDLEIEPVGAVFASILITQPTCQTMWNGNADISFQTIAVSDTIKSNLPLRLLVSADSKSHKVTKLLKLQKDFSASGSFGKFKPGKVLFNVT